MVGKLSWKAGGPQKKLASEPNNKLQKASSDSSFLGQFEISKPVVNVDNILKELVLNWKVGWDWKIIRESWIPKD